MKKIIFKTLAMIIPALIISSVSAKSYNENVTPTFRTNIETQVIRDKPGFSRVKMYIDLKESLKSHEARLKIQGHSKKQAIRMTYKKLLNQYEEADRFNNLSSGELQVYDLLIKSYKRRMNR